MSTLDSIRSLTDNVETVFKGLKVNITYDLFEEFTEVENSILPNGQIIYLREDTPNDFEQSQSYLTANFLLRVIYDEKDGKERLKLQQQYIHSIKTNFTVDGLNIGDFGVSGSPSEKLVTNVDLINLDLEFKDNRSMVTYEMAVRYRNVDT
jgi:hypothetical protein